MPRVFRHVHIAKLKTDVRIRIVVNRRQRQLCKTLDYWVKDLEQSIRLRTLDVFALNLIDDSYLLYTRLAAKDSG